LRGGSAVALAPPMGWRCRAGLLGPGIELAADGALDDAEQIPGGVADAMLAAPCGPFVQHGLPQGSVHLLQRHLAPACCSAFSSAKRLGHCRSPSARACAVVRTS
jgi:hypothetical protein